MNLKSKSMYDNFTKTYRLIMEMVTSVTSNGKKEDEDIKSLPLVNVVAFLLYLSKIELVETNAKLLNKILKYMELSHDESSEYKRLIKRIK